MESYSVVAVLSATDKNFSSTMNSANNSMSTLDSSADKTRGSILKIAGAAVAVKAVDVATNALKSSLDGAISRYDTMNKFPLVMQQIGFSTEESTASIERLSAGIDGLPTSLDGITASTQSIALLTGDLEMATETSLALNNAFLASGSATADAERGLVQYTQMLSKGSVDMQSWRTLQETMGYALRETAKQLGIASGDTNELYSALQSGSITFDQFNGALIECSTRTGGFAEVAKTASAGIGTSFQNLQTAVVKNVTNIIAATDEMLADNGWGTLAGNIDSAKGVINTAGSAIASTIKTTGKVVKELSPVLAAGAAGWVAYGAATSITDKVKKASSAITTAKKVIGLATTETVKMSSALAVGGAAAQTVTTRTRAMTLVLTASQKATALKTAAEAKGYSVNAAGQVVTAKGVALTTAETAELLASTGAVTAKTVALGVLSGEIPILTALQLAWNAAISANPIGVAVVAVTALVAGVALLATKLSPTVKAYKEFAEESKKVAESADDLSSSIETNTKARDDSIASIEAEGKAAGELAKKIQDLSAKENKSAGDKQTLQTYVDSLNSSIEGLGLQYDSEADSLSMGTAEIEKRIEAYTAQTEAQRAAAAYSEVLAEQTRLEAELSAVQEQRGQSLDANVSKALDLVGVFTAGLLPATIEATGSTKELEEAEAALIEQQGKLALEAEYLEGVITKTSNDQANAVASSVERQISSLEDLSASEQEVVESLSSTWQDYADAATNMFDTLSDKQEISVEKMSDNLEENQRVVGEWGTNLETLMGRSIDETGRTIDTGLLAKLQEMGPEGAGYVAALVSASDEELQRLSDAFANAGETSTNALKTAYDLSDVPQGAADLITRTGDTMQQTIDSTFSVIGASATEQVGTGMSENLPALLDSIGKINSSAAEALQAGAEEYSSAGTDAANGYVQGVQSGEGAITGAATGVITAGIEAAKAAQNSNSPSVVYQGLGTDAISGYVLGVESSQGTIAAAMSAAMQTGVDAATQTLSSGLNSAVSSAGKAFNQLGGYALAGMSGMNAAISGGISTAKASFNQIPANAKTSMSGMNSAIQSGMSTSVRTITSSMQSINTAVKSGFTTAQNTAKTSITSITNTVKSGFTTITSVARSGMSSFTSVIRSGMSTANSAVSSGNASMIAKVRTLQSSFYTSGAYASQGLANGINARAGSAIAAAQSVADRVAAIMASALQEHSPSRVTRKIGAYASEGLAIGLLEEINSVEKASRLVANTISDIIEPNIGGISDRLAYAGDYSYASEDLLNYMSDNTYTFNIYSEYNGRVAAQASATYTQTELEKIETLNNRRNGIRTS